MIQEHADALIGPLRSVSTLVVYPVPNAAPGSAGPAVPPGATPPYVSVHIVVSRGLTPGLDMRSGRVIGRAYLHCVGEDDIAARAVLQQVETALLDVVPVIAGRRCFPIRFESAAPVDPEYGTGHQVVTHTVVYRLESVPDPTAP